MRLAQKLKTKTLLTLMRGIAGVERLIKGQCWSEGKWYGGWYDQEKRTFYQKESKNG